MLLLISVTFYCFAGGESMFRPLVQIMYALSIVIWTGICNNLRYVYQTLHLNANTLYLNLYYMYNHGLL